MSTVTNKRSELENFSNTNVCSRFESLLLRNQDRLFLQLYVVSATEVEFEGEANKMLKSYFVAAVASMANFYLMLFLFCLSII